MLNYEESSYSHAVFSLPWPGFIIISEQEEIATRRELTEEEWIYNALCNYL